MLFLTEWIGSYGAITAGPGIKAESWDHALVRLEYALAMEWVPANLEIIGELVEEIGTSGDPA